MKMQAGPSKLAKRSAALARSSCEGLHWKQQMRHFPASRLALLIGRARSAVFGHGKDRLARYRKVRYLQTYQGTKRREAPGRAHEKCERSSTSSGCMPGKVRLDGQRRGRRDCIGRHSQPRRRPEDQLLSLGVTVDASKRAGARKVPSRAAPSYRPVTTQPGPTRERPRAPKPEAQRCLQGGERARRGTGWRSSSSQRAAPARFARLSKGRNGAVATPAGVVFEDPSNANP
ncbi:uncharacterized protein LOC129325808 [Eublepharis macularius]|uniref:Uncharacterized protein LOC129325808 n=1 Tax=Eublepharis macularius TaxID=481883 RepID=A0AA97J1J4_EUBMA|nr:uncharacterized protein LOC129325808 [Eublepharis macularius]